MKRFFTALLTLLLVLQLASCYIRTTNIDTDDTGATGSESESERASESASETDDSVIDPPPSIREHESVPTPTPDSENYISGVIDNIGLYFTFDGTTSSAFGNYTTTENGMLCYSEGYFGNGVDLHSASLSLGEVKTFGEAFSFAFWIKLDHPDGVLLSNKMNDTDDGSIPGFICEFATDKLSINISDGETYFDCMFDLPEDYAAGWMYVSCTVDLRNSVVGVSFDFGDFAFVTMNDNQKVSEIPVFFDYVIGQDASLSNVFPLPAFLDEFILTSDVLSNSDLQELAAHYGVSLAD